MDPQVTSKAIYNAFKEYTVDELKRVSSGRRNLIWALEKLCFWEETFYISALTLLMFAAGENESWSNNATGIFLQLFHAFLSGTQAKPEQRFQIINEALGKDKVEYKVLGVKALGSAIETRGFSRMAGVEKQGVRPVKEEWKPRTWGEVFEYWDTSLRMLTKIGCEKNELGKLAREQIVDNFIGLVEYGRMDTLEGCILTIGKSLDFYWPEILEKIKVIIRYERSDMSKEKSRQLEYWLDLYTPKAFDQKLELLISMPSWQYEENGKGELVDISEIEAKNLAMKCIKNMDKLYQNFNIIFTGEQQKGYIFGYTLGKNYDNHEEFIKKSIVELANSEDPNPIVLGGYLNAIKSSNYSLVSQTLDYFASDCELVKHIVHLTGILGSKQEDMNRLINLIKDEKVKVEQVRYLSYGQITSDLDVEEIINLCETLMEYNLEGKLVALNILVNYTRVNKDKFMDFKDMALCLVLDVKVIKNLGKYSQTDFYYWREIIKGLLELEDGTDFAIELCKKTTEIIYDDKSMDYQKYTEIFY